MCYDLETRNPSGVIERTVTVAKVYAELEYGDVAWKIQRIYVSNQFVDDYGRIVTITEDNETIMEDDSDLVAIIPALDE